MLHMCSAKANSQQQSPKLHCVQDWLLKRSVTDRTPLASTFNFAWYQRTGDMRYSKIWSELWSTYSGTSEYCCILFLNVTLTWSQMLQWQCWSKLDVDQKTLEFCVFAYGFHWRASWHSCCVYPNRFNFCQLLSSCFMLCLFGRNNWKLLSGVTYPV